MQIVAASDIHGQWNVVQYPKGDILILAGDILSDHSFNPQSDANAGLQKEELLELDHFCGYYLKDILGFKHVLLVAGNHDFVFQKHPDISKKLKHLTYLEDTSVVINGIKFHGSPHQPWFWDWAFNFPCHLKEHGGNWFKYKHYAIDTWAKIPDDVDVLITHTPPLNILDKTGKGLNRGCQFLADRIEQLKKLKFHVFGHIHASQGTKIINNKVFLNVAQMRGHESLCNEPAVFFIETPQINV